VAMIALLLILRDPAGRMVTSAAACAALASIAATLASLRPYEEVGQAGLEAISALVETGLLLLIIVFVVARAPVRHSIATTALAAIAVGIIVLRFPSASISLTTVLGCVLWGMVALGAAGAGGYLRWSMARRAGELRNARRAQRLQLAADLHDFVAHDVSEMLALAQAGQFVAETEAGRAAEIFHQIEAAALHAMDSLDHTVKMLGDMDSDDGEGTPRATIAGLADLAERFRRSGPAEVALDIDPQVSWAIRHQTSAALYRVVVEALTNVRRHAPNASRVRIAARQTGRDVELSVTDNGQPGEVSPVTTRSGGLGLRGLTARVAELGGTLTAGPEPTGGWRVVARLPLTPVSRR
jgi:signal transduction histidine kinase